LRRAAAGDRDNLEVQLALAGAYLAAGQAAEGRDVLLEFRERHPDHPEVNLRLARLEASGEQPDEAIRFYQAALLGLWGPEQLEQRRTLRIEYIGFLLDRTLASRALSESLLLAGEMPEDLASHVKLGELMRRAGDPARALAQFESALALDRRQPDATARAGEAAFEAGSYRLADRYLRQVPDDPRSRSLRPVLELIIALDPLLPGLASRERHRRVASAAGRLETEILECRARRCQSADAACAEAEALAREVTAARAQLKKNSRKNDAVDPGSSMVVGLAEKASTLCGPNAAIFRALSLIAARHATPP
jgi:Tfp pilus assembly protein PilF